MTKIHIADDGWEFAEVEFKSTISESEFNICDACHKTDEVMKLTLPETAYYRNGQAKAGTSGGARTGVRWWNTSAQPAGRSYNKNDYGH